MKILLFGISNVGKTTIGKIISKKLGVDFFDLDDEIKKYYNISLEEFVHIGTIKERDKKRGDIIRKIINNNNNCIIAVSPMSNAEYFEEFLNKDLIAIELIDSARNVFDRLVFSDKEDNIYEDHEYKNKYKKYYINEIYEDLLWYGNVYKNIVNKYNVNNQTPETAADDIIKIYNFKELLTHS